MVGKLGQVRHTGICRQCFSRHGLTRKGLLMVHGPRWRRCDGGGTEPQNGSHRATLVGSWERT